MKNELLFELDPVEIGFATTTFAPVDEGGPQVTYSRTGNSYHRHEFYGPEGHPTLPGAPTEVTYAPAVAIFSEDGRENSGAGDVIVRMEWIEDFKAKHRETGPALIAYRSDGSIRREVYYRHGKRTNDFGPADVSYAPNGGRAVRYFLDDRPVSEEAHAAFAEALTSGAPREWALAYLEGTTSSD